MVQQSKCYDSISRTKVRLPWDLRVFLLYRHVHLPLFCFFSLTCMPMLALLRRWATWRFKPWILEKDQSLFKKACLLTKRTNPFWLSSKFESLCKVKFQNYLEMFVSLLFALMPMKNTFHMCCVIPCFTLLPCKGWLNGCYVSCPTVVNNPEY